MRTDGDGRFCDRCRLHVTDVASLDADGLERLLAAAADGPVCARFELERGQPRTKLGLAAGLIVMALAGCATPGTDTVLSPDAIEIGLPDVGASISGEVRGPDGVPLANAYVIVQSTALVEQRERLTNERGAFGFDDLPPGNYTIQVLAGNADVSKIVELPKDARYRANFSVNPEEEGRLMGAMVVVEHPMIDTSSAASSYSSRMIEYR